jgi:hypothetical protein
MAMSSALLIALSMVLLEVFKLPGTSGEVLNRIEKNLLDL